MQFARPLINHAPSSLTKGAFAANERTSDLNFEKLTGAGACFAGIVSGTVLNKIGKATSSLVELLSRLSAV